MALLTPEDLETAMGTTFTETQLGKAEFLINGLSAFIQTKTGAVFEVVTGATDRFQADSYGKIRFYNLPVNGITLVHDYVLDYDIDEGYWAFDGIDTISGFYGNQVVDITYDYGQEPTDDVKYAATMAVMRGMTVPSNNSNIKSQQVGDVIVQYQGMLPLTDDELSIFEAYGVQTDNLRLDLWRNVDYYYNQASYPFDLTRWDGYSWDGYSGY